MEKYLRKRSRSQDNENLVKISGWLKTKCRSFFQQYKNTFCVLQKTHFYIYTDESKTKTLAVINFNQIKVMLNRDLKDPSTLKMSFEGSSKVFYLKSSRIAEWEKCLFDHINQSLTFVTSVCSLSLSKEFWKFEFIAENEFSQEVQTGDIILFKGKSRMCGAIRKFLNCEFDHIGVFYILNDIIYIFESSRGTGVTLLPWNEFVNRGWHNLYRRIAIRKLQIQRNSQFLAKAHQFVIETEGKPYKLKFWSNEGQGFFCSELVAEFFRKTGVLYQNTPSYKYFPKHFVSFNKLNLVQGDLGPLLDIKITNN